MNEENLVFDIETTGLSPFEDRITVIGLRANNKDETFIDINEEFMLREFWSVVDSFPKWKLIGFNVMSFDIPFLIIRSFKYGIKIPDLKYKVLDLRLVLSFGNKFAKGKLDDYITLLNLPSKFNGLTGLEAISLWRDYKYDELEAYVLQDVNMTSQIYARCREIGLIC